MTKQEAKEWMTENVALYMNDGEVNTNILAEDCCMAHGRPVNHAGDFPDWMLDLAIDIAIAHEDAIMAVCK